MVTSFTEEIFLLTEDLTRKKNSGNKLSLLDMSRVQPAGWFMKAYLLKPV